MFFGPKFTNQQLDALAKSIMDFNELGDAAILRARLLDNPMEEIPLTDEYLPIGMFMSKEKKKKVLARHSFNMGVITGFAFQFVDYAKGQEKYIDDIVKQALKRSKVVGYGIDYTSKLYKDYIRAKKRKNINHEWSMGVAFAKFFLIEFEGVNPDLIV